MTRPLRKRETVICGSRNQNVRCCISAGGDDVDDDGDDGFCLAVFLNSP